jgi:hypothetical protein
MFPVAKQNKVLGTVGLVVNLGWMLKTISAGNLHEMFVLCV